MSSTSAVAEAALEAATAATTPASAPARPVLSHEQRRRREEALAKMNVDFCDLLIKYVESKDEDEGKDKDGDPDPKHLLELVLVEYLSAMTKHDEGYASLFGAVFPIICGNNGNKKGRLLQGVLTDSLWEHANAFVAQFQAYLQDRTLTMPGIFVEEDLPDSTGTGTDAETDLGADEEDQHYLVYHHSAGHALSTSQISLRDLRVKGISQTIAASMAAAKPAETLPKANWQTFHIAKLPETIEMMPAPQRLNLSVPREDDDDMDDTNKPNKKKRKRLPLRGSAEDRVYIEGHPNDNDVLYGRGGGTNNHKGNIRYLLTKLKLQPAYILLATQKGKKAISLQLVQTVKDWGGRFVDRDETGRWYIVDDSIARKKASQTLREDKTPFEQASKRTTLERKLQELESAGGGKKSNSSTQERHAGEALLGLSGGWTAQGEEGGEGAEGEQKEDAAMESAAV